MSVGTAMTVEARTLPLVKAVDILDSRRIPVNSEEREKRKGEIPYYGATGQVGWIDTPIFDEELVLLGEDGAPFLNPAKPKAYLIRGKSWVNNHAHVLRAKPGLLNSFLLHQLNNLDYRPYVSGTTRLKLPQGPMKQIPVLVPPEVEQRRIVAEIEKQFTRLEAGVGALKRVQANLKRYRATVLKAACEGKLVSTEAELARKEGRSYETGPQLLERILSARREAWEKERAKSGHKKNYVDPISPDMFNVASGPVGWTWASLSALVKQIGDVDHKMPKPFNPGIPYISTRDFSGENDIDFSNAKRISRADYESLSRKIVPSRGDLLMSRYGTVGEVRLITQPAEFQASYSIAILKTLPFPRLNAYLFYALRSEPLQNQIRRDVRASAQPDLGLDSIRKFVVPLPPSRELERIAAEVERRLSAVEALENVAAASLARASRLRQSILHAAFSGKM